MTLDGGRIDERIPTPALLLDLDKLEANLDTMAGRCRTLGVRLRPHAKTHKCVEIARRQAELGALGLTVSTLEEGEVFVEAGFRDLTWAFPFVPGRLKQAEALAKRCRLGLVVDSQIAIDVLESTGRDHDVWLKVDSGYHRAGVDPDSPTALRYVERLTTSPNLRFRGLLSHSGHAYRSGTDAVRRAAAREERELLVGLAERLRTAGLEVAEVSVGSTPGMAHIDHLEGVDEARPGNYALYDRTQVGLGSCSVGDCAVTVLASVVSASPRHSVVDAGALALSKDPGPADADASFGRLFSDYEAGELADDCRISSLSQEHGIVDRPLAVGQLVRILPNHSCLTVAQFDHFVVLREGRVVDHWTIHRRRG